MPNFGPNHKYIVQKNKQAVFGSFCHQRIIEWTHSGSYLIWNNETFDKNITALAKAKKFLEFLPWNFFNDVVKSRNQMGPKANSCSNFSVIFRIFFFPLISIFFPLSLPLSHNCARTKSVSMIMYLKSTNSIVSTSISRRSNDAFLLNFTRNMTWRLC